MSRWWRAYDDALNDPKVQRLPGDLFKTWFNVLCIASKHNGILPDVPTIAFMLRCDEQKATIDLEQLTACGLIDRAGDRLQPHNWQGRQHKSDVSNERVARYRERQRNVTDAVTVTPPEQNRTDSERADARAVFLCKEISKLYDAAGFLPPDTGRAHSWIAQGYDPHLVLAKLAEKIAKGKPSKPLQYFEPILAEAHAVKKAAKKTDTTPVSRETQERAWARALEDERRSGAWCSRVPKQDIPADFIAKFKSGSLPHSRVS